MTMTRRPCACRRAIEAEPTEDAIAAAVAEHQRQPGHRAYRAAQALEDERLAFDVKIAPGGRLYPRTPPPVTLADYRKAPARSREILAVGLRRLA